MREYEEYTDLPLAVLAADFAMDEYEPDQPTMPGYPFVESFFKDDDGYCSRRYDEVMENNSRIIRICAGEEPPILYREAEELMELSTWPLMRLAEYVGVKMFEWGWKAGQMAMKNETAAPEQHE